MCTVNDHTKGSYQEANQLYLGSFKAYKEFWGTEGRNIQDGQRSLGRDFRTKMPYLHGQHFGHLGCWLNKFLSGDQKSIL